MRLCVPTFLKILEDDTGAETPSSTFRDRIVYRRHYRRRRCRYRRYLYRGLGGRVGRRLKTSLGWAGLSLSLLLS